MRKQWWMIGVVIILAVLAGGVWYGHRQSSPVIRTASSPHYVEKENVHLVAVGDSLTHGQGDEKKRVVMSVLLSIRLNTTIVKRR